MAGNPYGKMTSIANQIDNLLPPKSSDLLRKAASVARRQGVSLYLMGGSVRDMLLGQKPLDIDITMVGEAKGFSQYLAEALDGDHPRLHKIVGSGKIAGTLTNDSNVEHYLGLGVKFIMIGWQAWVTAGLQAFKEKINAAS